MPKKALIVQPGAVGDVLLTLPLVRLLKREYGFGSVEMMGQRERLDYLLGRSDIDRTISLEKVPLHPLFGDPAEFNPAQDDPLLELFRPYELIVTFLSDDKGHFEQNLVYTAIRTHPAEVVTLPLFPPEDSNNHAAVHFLQRFVDEMIEKPRRPVDFILDEDFLQPSSEAGIHTPDEADKIVLLHPGSGGEHKCWPLANFVAMASALQERELQPLFLVGPAEKERWDAESIACLRRAAPLSEDLSLEEVYHLVQNCRAYIGNDNGITHLAGMLGRPTLSLFGNSNPTHWRPLGHRSRVCKADEPGQWPAVREVLVQFDELELDD